MTRKKITDPDLKRTESIHIRLSPVELATIKAAADKNKMTISELLRSLAIEFRKYQK
jgi:predicted DNA binding CopG/RHH family protein